MRLPRHLATLLYVMAAGTVGGLSTPVEAAAQSRTHVLIVVGLGGTAEYRETFHEQARSLREALIEEHGVRDADVVYLGERVDVAPDVIRDRSTRDNVMGTLSRFAEDADASDRVLVVLIGHGTSGSGGESFNLPGPDASPSEFAAALDGFPSQSVAFVHTGSGSGAFLEPLAGPDRIVITATRSGRELNATRFAAHFVSAFTGEGADIDRDGSISLQEAFTYARDEVARHYEAENQILTENAVLQDGDAGLASTFAFGGPGAATDVPETDDPEVARLYEERGEIQSRIDELRTLSGSIDEDVYLERMEELLVELALKNREIRAAGGGGG
ncbi:MAG: hypothetical protein WD995_03420 [Gemmatimonadota bacterium]